MLTDEQLSFYNQQGLIPGPEEEEEEFIRRANYCLTLKAHLPDLFETFTVKDLNLGNASLHQAFPLTKQLYGLTPEWIPLLFSDYKLAPWHGGCAWIFQINSDTPTGSFFQLRQAFRASSEYLKIYNRNELIAHELVHAARMVFQELQFEEIMAYRSSNSSFRRWMGPIIQSSYESILFLFSILLVFLLETYGIYSLDSTSMQMGLIASLLPIGLFSLALLRLWKRQSQFSRCLHNLEKVIKKEHKPLAMAVRLTDLEIRAFSTLNPEAIQTYFEENCGNSLRLKMIHNIYIDRVA